MKIEFECLHLKAIRLKEIIEGPLMAFSQQ